jgi:hypothetical protein
MSPWWTTEKQKLFKKKKAVGLEGIELQSVAWKSNAQPTRPQRRVKDNGCLCLSILAIFQKS